MSSAASTQAGAQLGKSWFHRSFPSTPVDTIFCHPTLRELWGQPAGSLYKWFSCYFWVPATLVLVLDNQGFHPAAGGINHAPLDTMRFVKVQICVFSSHRKCSSITASKHYSQFLLVWAPFTQQILMLHHIAGPAALDSLISVLFCFWLCFVVPPVILFRVVISVLTALIIT